MDAPVRRCKSISFPNGRRGRGRSRKSLEEVIKYDLKFLGLSEDIAQDRSMWRSRIKVIEHR